jgi:hypothetical protein
MSQSNIPHLPMECTDRYCGLHRDLWRYYEDVIAAKPMPKNVTQMPRKTGSFGSEG